jgi:hypothetical protein
MPTASAFSVVDGGPLCALMRRLGWTRPDGAIDHLRACIVLVALAWGPLLVAALSARLTTGQWLAIDWSVHTRLLVAVPLLLRADASLHVRTRVVLERFTADGWAPDQADRVDDIVTRAVRHRDAVLPEAALLCLAVVASQIVVWNWGGMPFVARRLTMARHLVAARAWYALVALPLFQFLVYRALWRWGIWIQLLWRLSRLRLQPLATHPDLAGGLEFLSRPSVGFAYVVAALSAAQAGVWADQVLHAGVQVTTLKWDALVFIVAGTVLALGPLAVMSGHLWRCQFEGRDDYAGLATDYTRQFQARWFEQRARAGGELLGSADIQSLADLANGYGVVDRMRFLPFSPRTLIAVVVAALLPMIPVALLAVPLPELLRKLGGAFLGKPG